MRWPFDARKGGNALENLTFASFEEFAAQRERLRDLFRRDAPEEAPILFLALNEAVNNAFLHGPPGVPVRLSIEIGPSGIVLRVRDEGPGFDWRSRPGPPERVPSPDLEGRRGLWILEHLLDRLTFNDAGNEIRMEKRRGALHPEKDLLPGDLPPLGRKHDDRRREAP